MGLRLHLGRRRASSFAFLDAGAGVAASGADADADTDTDTDITSALSMPILLSSHRVMDRFTLGTEEKVQSCGY